jgi:hypothetical protein
MQGVAEDRDAQFAAFGLHGSLGTTGAKAYLGVGGLAQ